MKKNVYLLMALSAIAVVGCQKDDSIDDSGQDLEQGTYEESIEGTPIGVSATYRMSDSQGSGLDFELPTEPVIVTSEWRKLVPADIENIGDFSKYEVAKARFKQTMLNQWDAFGDYDPVNISFNDAKIGDKGTNASVDQGWEIEIQFKGTGVYDSVPPGYGVWEPVPGFNARVETNYSNTTQNLGGYTLFSQITTKTATWEVSSTSGLSIGGGIGIPHTGQGGILVEWNSSETSSEGGSKDIQYTENYRTPYIDVPAGKSIRYVLEQRWIPLITKWSVPVQFRGVVGADYGKRVHSHYFWNVPAEEYFWDYQNSDEEYTINFVERYKLEVRVAAYPVDFLLPRP